MKVKHEKTVNKALRDRIKQQLEAKFRKENAESYLKRTITEAFRKNGELDADRIIVHVHDGTVELWGSVRTWAGINEAERICWTAPGVSKVDAHLKIGR